MTYGYVRVSAKDQNLDRQIIALRQFPVRIDKIYADKASGKDFEQPAYKRLVSKIAPGDVVVVKSVDRLGRNYNEILEEWRFITKEKQCAIVVIDMPLLDTRETTGGLTGVFVADLVLQILSYVAQIERDNIRQRQAEGIAAAKARGVRFGRPPIQRPKNYARVNTHERMACIRPSCKVVAVSRLHPPLSPKGSATKSSGGSDPP